MKDVALVISWRYELVNFYFFNFFLQDTTLGVTGRCGTIRGDVCVCVCGGRRGRSMVSDWLRWRETEGQVRGLWSVIDHFGLADGRYFMLCQTRIKPRRRQTE